MYLRAFALFGLLFTHSLAFAGDGPESGRLIAFGGMSPTKLIKQTDLYSNNYAFGVAYRMGKGPFSLGMDFLQTRWYSERIYDFESHLLNPGQSVGAVVVQMRHVVIGIAPNFGVRLGGAESFWAGTVLQAGVHLAWALSPNTVSIGNSGQPGDRKIVIPYLRFQRRVVPHLPMVVMAQLQYLPSVGILSYFMIGLNIAFLK